jgi:hypothetical protein
VRRLAAIAIVAVAAAVAPARADDALDEARRLQAALEYEQALVVVERAIDRGGNDRARYVELELLAGTLAGGLDRADAARDHFARALALRPDATLPYGTSPKITAPFDAARATATALRISAHASAGEVVLDVAGDPLHLVAGMRVASQLVHATRAPLPAGATTIDVVAIDTRGNELWSGTIAVAIERPPPPPPPHRSLLARWQTYAIVTGVAVAGGALCAWRFQVAQDEWNTLRAEDGQHDYSQLVAVENRARGWAIGANVAIGVVAAGAIATTIAFVGGRRRVAVVASPTALAIGGRF